MVWKKIVPLLQAEGHDVYTPTLTGLGERAHLANAGVGLGTHIEDVANVFLFEDLAGVTLVGTSSSGTVITGVADRLPERIDQVVYLDAFLPSDGDSTRDLIPPDRRPATEALVESEGEGWMLPRFSPAPWERFLPEAWQVADDEDVRWMLARLRPTPFGHFTEPLRLQSDGAEQIGRVYIRCLSWPNAGFDRYAAAAQSSAGWTYRELTTSHLPYVTHPDDLTAALLELGTDRTRSAGSYALMRSNPVVGDPA